MFIIKGIKPHSILIMLMCIIGSLATLSLIGQYLRFGIEHGGKNLLDYYFNLDGERPIPTLFSSLLIFLNAILLALIFAYSDISKDRYKYYWLVLAGIFLYLAIDEEIGIHEVAFDFLIPVTGIDFMHFWIIPASLLMLALAASYWNFVFSLSNPFKILVIVSGLVYIGGAMGVEGLGGLYAQQHGKANLPYMMLSDIEETCEMMGMSIFLYTLHSYLITLVQHPFKLDYSMPIR